MEFEVFDLGLIEFEKAWEFQKEIFSEVKSGKLNSALILCRHYPVITVGRSGRKENIRAAEPDLRQMRLSVYEAERGGDVTYHGPGQITAYPVFNLRYLKKDIHLFFRQLEGVGLKLLKGFGVAAGRRPGLTGVWIGNNKIASIGIAIKDWITYHGISINVKREDLGNFSLIRPCGMDVKMTSLETELSKEVDIDNVKGHFVESFKETFEFTAVSLAAVA